jgi:hypothetical protein
MSNPTTETVAKAAGPLDGLAPGRIVIYTDATGIEYVGIIGRVIEPGGMVNLVTFAREGGDAPTTLETAVRYKPGVGARYTGWRFPDRKPAT